MSLCLTHRHGRHVDVAWNDLVLFRYTYGAELAQYECPKPHLHPVRTLSGNVVTVARPHDHRWHHGLAMTLTDVSGQNFWGGPTYVRDKGYVGLDNVGRQQHAAWRRMAVNSGSVELLEDVDWITAAGKAILKEERAVRLSSVNPKERYWTLEWVSRLANVSGATLEIGSPTTNGRPNAGYGGLFWRGPRSFLGCKVLGAGGLEGQESLMGARGAWLAFVGKHDEVDDVSTLVFIDSPANPRYPTKWFVRSEPYACASFAFMFDEIYELAAGASFDLRYRIVVADESWERDAIERIVESEQAGMSAS